MASLKSKKSTRTVDIPSVLRQLADDVHRPIDEVQKERIWNQLQRVTIELPELQQSVQPKRASLRRKRRFLHPTFYAGIAGIAVCVTGIGIGIAVSHKSTQPMSSLNHPLPLISTNTRNPVIHKNTINALRGTQKNLPEISEAVQNPATQPVKTNITISGTGTDPLLTHVTSGSPFLAFTKAEKGKSPTYVTSLIDGATYEVESTSSQLIGTTSQGILIFQDPNGSFSFQPGKGILQRFPSGAFKSTGVNVSSTNEWALFHASGPSDMPFTNKHSIQINQHTLALQKGTMTLSAAWSPDGTKLAYILEGRDDKLEIQWLNPSNFSVHAPGSRSVWTASTTLVNDSINPLWQQQNRVQWTSNDWLCVSVPSGVRLWNVSTGAMATIAAPVSFLTAGSNIVTFANSKNGNTTVVFYQYQNQQWVKYATSSTSATIPGGFVEGVPLPNGQVVVMTADPNRPLWLLSPDQSPVSLPITGQSTVSWLLDTTTRTIYYLQSESPQGTSSASSQRMTVWKLVLPGPSAAMGGLSH